MVLSSQQIINRAPLLLRGPTAPFWAQKNRRTIRQPRFLKFRSGSKILVTRDCNRRRNAALNEAQNLDCPLHVSSDSLDDLAGPHGPGWLHGMTADSNFSGAAGCGCDASGFVETNRPEPFVHSDIARHT